MTDITSSPKKCVHGLINNLTRLIIQCTCLLLWLWERLSSGHWLHESADCGLRRSSGNQSAHHKANGARLSRLTRLSRFYQARIVAHCHRLQLIRAMCMATVTGERQSERLGCSSLHSWYLWINLLCYFCLFVCLLLWRLNRIFTVGVHSLFIQAGSYQRQNGLSQQRQMTKNIKSCKPVNVTTKMLTCVLYIMIYCTCLRIDAHVSYKWWFTPNESLVINVHSVLQL